MEEAGLTATASPQPGTSDLAAAAAPPPWMWLALPDYILVRISAFLPCRADRVHMACVHRQWNAAVRGLSRPRPAPIQPQLPWLIFPRADGEAPTFYSAMNRSFHSLGRLPSHVRRARFCGSAHHGWLVLALESSGEHELYNLDSGQRIPLPKTYTAPTPTDQDSPLVVRVATLSGPPSPDSDRCTVAAIAHVGRTLTSAFWGEGDECWFIQGDLMTAAPQDVIRHYDSFFFVTSREELISVGPTYGYGPYLQRADYEIPQRADYDADVRRASMIRHYLEVSLFRLLMVVKYILEDDAVPDEFRIFALQVVVPIPMERPQAIWQDLGERALDGRMLFLGAGCSRSFEINDYYGCGFQESTIYFLDDGLAYTLSPDGTKRYSFTDMGRYSMEKRTSEPWPPGHPSTSDNAPPTWWLH